MSSQSLESFKENEVQDNTEKIFFEFQSKSENVQLIIFNNITEILKNLQDISSVILRKKLENIGFELENKVKFIHDSLKEQEVMNSKLQEFLKSTEVFLSGEISKSNMIFGIQGDSITILAPSTSYELPNVTDSLVRKSEEQLLYMMVTNIKNTTKYVTAFAVQVDNYAELVIPGSSNLLTKNDDEYTQVQMLIKDSSGVKRTSLKKFRHRDPDRGNFAVFNRTLLINVNRGVITTFDWAPTTCIGDIQALAIEDICGYICGATCNANITVFVAYSGTDADGKQLNSFSRDIWRLKNAFTKVQ